MKSALVLYPHQLFPVAQLPEVDTVIMVEEPLYFGTDHDQPLKVHKQKIILHRASMRRYVEEVLWPAAYEVEYIDLDVLYDSGDILDRAKKFDRLYVFDTVDERLTKRILEARRSRDHAPALEFLPSPNFYLKEQEVRQFLAERREHPFDAFYQWQRERFNVLIGDDYKPLGGQWSFENEGNIKLPKDAKLPTFEVYGNNKHVQEATDFVRKHFADNPGSTDFIWPTSHEEASDWLNSFLKDRIDDFGTYQHALDGQAIWLHHSALSVSLNIGLLSPQQVVDAALKRHEQKPVPLSSLETFIRYIMGWREFMRGSYVIAASRMRTANSLKHERKLTAAWYSGTTGLPPFDDLVKKALTHAYVPHNQRLMVAVSLMLLCEIHPDDIRRWLSELFVDSYDWSVLSNVYGMCQLAEKQTSPVKLPISASNYLMQISHYERGQWADVWDGLFWRFVDKHQSLLKHNPQLRVLVSRLDRLDADHRRIIGYRADDFLNRYTLI